MRDYLIVSVVLASLPIGLVRPYYGLLVYAWISYMNPHMLAWSFAQSFPVAKIAAISTVAGLIITRSADTSPIRYRETIVMALMWCMFTVSTLLAVNPTEAWPQWQDTSKLIVMAVIASMLLTSRERIRYFLLVIALSIGFYGFKGGLFSVMGRGEGMVWGPGNSIIAGNNNIGLALNMCLPLLWYLASEEQGWRKLGLYVMFGLSIPAIMFTYSRASFLTLLAVLLAIVLRCRHRLALICLALAAIPVVMPFVPQKFWDRQATTLEYERDGSAQSRLDNWEFCWRVALDRPLTGAGFQFFTPEMIERYDPSFGVTYAGKAWDTHNIYFAMLTAHGFPGLLLFVLLLAFCFLSSIRLRRQVRYRDDLKWIVGYCYTVEASLLALIINGAFVNMEYFDLVYHLPAVIVSLKLIARQILLTTQPERVMDTAQFACAAN